MRQVNVTIDSVVYDGLRKTIGPRKISKFIEDIARPYVAHPDLESAYELMAKDQSSPDCDKTPLTSLEHL